MRPGITGMALEIAQPMRKDPAQRSTPTSGPSSPTAPSTPTPPPAQTTPVSPPTVADSAFGARRHGGRPTLCRTGNTHRGERKPRQVRHPMSSLGPARAHRSRCGVHAPWTRNADDLPTTGPTCGPILFASLTRPEYSFSKISPPAPPAPMTLPVLRSLTPTCCALPFQLQYTPDLVQTGSLTTCARRRPILAADEAAGDVLHEHREELARDAAGGGTCTPPQNCASKKGAGEGEKGGRAEGGGAAHLAEPQPLLTEQVGRRDAAGVEARERDARALVVAGTRRNNAQRRWKQGLRAANARLDLLP